MIQVKRSRLVVALTSGRTVIGTRALSWPWTLRLRDAQVCEPGAQPVRADGVVCVPRRAVDYVQYVG